MPAQIVDELDESGQPITHGDALGAAVAEQAQAAAEDAAHKEFVLDGDDVPEKYRGKTAQELLEIVQNQDSHIGRQGQELGDLRGQVGTLRGLVDKSLELRESGHIGREDIGVEDDLTDDQFITDPRDAVTKTVKRETREQEARLARLEKQNAALDFARRHPTAQTDVESDEFREFVNKGTVRGKLANKAFKDLDNIDFEAAEELWELWEDYKSMTPSQQDVTDEQEDASQEDVSQEEDKQAPAMLRTGSSGDVGGSTKPVYSQSALNRLQNEDPDTYWASDTQAKIQAAYAEGRVIQD